MGFRTLEISNVAEIHIKEGQMEITTEEGVAVIPIKDLNQIIKQKLCRLLRLTEKQYNNIYMVAGGFDYQEKQLA